MKRNIKCFEAVCDILSEYTFCDIDPQSMKYLQQYCEVIDNMEGYRIEGLEVEVDDRLQVIIRIATYYAELSTDLLILIQRTVSFNVYSTDDGDTGYCVMEFTFPRVFIKVT